MKQLYVDPTYLTPLLDDIWCVQNRSNWICPLIPDWAEKIKFQCDNSSCIEYCSLHMKANLEHYLLYAGSLIFLSCIAVWILEKYSKLLLKKYY